MSFKVLLVEDDEAVLRTLKAVFETRGFGVSTACCAADASSALPQGDFDLVLTDMRMENASAGYEVVRLAKSQPYNPLVVILSAFPIPAPEWQQSGADAMFLKGGGVLRMLEEVDRMLHRKKAARGEAPGNARVHNKQAG
jgi:CheY-like chemotaxis protein